MVEIIGTVDRNDNYKKGSDTSAHTVNTHSTLYSLTKLLRDTAHDLQTQIKLMKYIKKHTVLSLALH